jgi:uncharacterized membrane protein YphA (DoxX/SURF4 family)
LEAVVRQNLPMILIRVIVGLAFLFDGVLKFARPGELGAERLAALGLPLPYQLAQAAGGIEIAGGAAILLNLYAGDAALVLLAITVSALIGTKIPILLGRPLGPFAPAKLDNYGWLSFFDAARADLCLAFSLLAILIDSGIRLGRRRHWYQGD